MPLTPYTLPHPQPPSLGHTHTPLYHSRGPPLFNISDGWPRRVKYGQQHGSCGGGRTTIYIYIYIMRRRWGWCIRIDLGNKRGRQDRIRDGGRGSEGNGTRARVYGIGVEKSPSFHQLKGFWRRRRRAEGGMLAANEGPAAFAPLSRPSTNEQSA